MNKIYLADYSNEILFTEGFKPGSKGFYISDKKFKKLTVIKAVNSSKYTEDELLSGKSKDGSLNIGDFSVTAEFITDNKELYVYFDSEDLDVETC